MEYFLIGLFIIIGLIILGLRMDQEYEYVF
jgi:hypothetical protein